MKVWAMSQFCYRGEVQLRVQPFSALMLCCVSNMRMRQVKVFLLQPLTPSNPILMSESHCLCSLWIALTDGCCCLSLYWFTFTRRLPDTYEGLHASCPPPADRNSVCPTNSARLHPVPLKRWSLPGLQLMCLSHGGVTELPPQYCDQVHHCSW